MVLNKDLDLTEDFDLSKDFTKDFTKDLSKNLFKKGYKQTNTKKNMFQQEVKTPNMLDTLNKDKKIKSLEQDYGSFCICCGDDVLKNRSLPMDVQLISLIDKDVLKTNEKYKEYFFELCLECEQNMNHASKRKSFLEKVSSSSLKMMKPKNRMKDLLN